jgi:hypothetical protein
MYGVVIPTELPFIGGWSLGNISAGYQNPIYGTFCVDARAKCAGRDVNGNSGVSAFYGVINNGEFVDDLIGRLVPDGSQGDILTVTQSALFSPTSVAVGQVVKGPGVLSGTKITEVLSPNSKGWQQYKVSVPQTVIGDGAGYVGTHPRLTAYVDGSHASFTVGAEGLVTFHAGLLEAFTSKLSYDVKLPLYQVNYVMPLDDLLGI